VFLGELSSELSGIVAAIDYDFTGVSVPYIYDDFEGLGWRANLGVLANYWDILHVFLSLGLNA
jgi:hypothetical protein